MTGSAPRSFSRPIGHAAALILPRVVLESKQQQKCDQQREDAHRLGNGEAEDQVAELALRGGWIAQRGSKIMAEDGADADAGAAHADASNAGADIFGGHWIHDEAPFFSLGLERRGRQWPG